MTFDPFSFETRAFDGVPVHIQKVPWANDFVYVRALMSVGAEHDPVGKEGLAHFFEHITFDGCEGHPTFLAIEQVARTLFFNTLNASTYFEGTVFYGKTSRERLGEALQFLTAFIFKPLMIESEVERERQVITQEIWERYTNERQEELTRSVTRMLYGDHNHGCMRSAAGWHDTVAQVSVEDLRTFHTETYHCGNLQLVLVGDIDFERDEQLIRMMTGAAPRGPSQQLPPKPDVWPAPKTLEYVISAQEYFGLSGKTIPKAATLVVDRLFPLQKNHEVCWLARSLIREVLFQRIRGALGATYTPSVRGSVAHEYMSLTIEVEVEPEKLDVVRAIISALFAELAVADPQHQTMFDELKSAYVERIRLIDLAAADIAVEAVDMLIESGTIFPLTRTLADALRVTYADISALIQKEFGADKLFWFVIKP